MVRRCCGREKKS